VCRQVSGSVVEGHGGCPVWQRAVAQLLEGLIERQDMKTSPDEVQLAPQLGHVEYVPTGRRKPLRLDAVKHQNGELPTPPATRERADTRRAQKPGGEFLHGVAGQSAHATSIG